MVSADSARAGGSGCNKFIAAGNQEVATCNFAVAVGNPVVDSAETLALPPLSTARLQTATRRLRPATKLLPSISSSLYCMYVQ